MKNDVEMTQLPTVTAERELYFVARELPTHIQQW